MKTNEEKEVRKEEITTENSQRRMLKDEELEQVSGGAYSKTEFVQNEIPIDDTEIISANAVR